METKINTKQVSLAFLIFNPIKENDKNFKKDLEFAKEDLKNGISLTDKYDNPFKEYEKSKKYSLKELKNINYINSVLCKNNSVLGNLITLGLFRYMMDVYMIYDLSSITTAIKQLNETHKILEPKGIDENNIIRNFFLETASKYYNKGLIKDFIPKLIDSVREREIDNNEKYIIQKADTYFNNLIEYGVCNYEEYKEAYKKYKKVDNLFWVSNNITSCEYEDLDVLINIVKYIGKLYKLNITLIF